MTETTYTVCWGEDLKLDPRNELSESLCAELLKFANTMADRARERVLHMKQDGFSIEWKEDGSPVSDVDKAVERELRALIEGSYPDHGIIGEEYENKNLEADYVWALDPIDGTEEFVNGIPLYGCMICLLYKNTPVVAVLEHPEQNYRVYGGFRLGAFLNGERLKLGSSSKFPSGEERLFLGAKKQFERNEKGQDIYKLLDQEFSNGRIYYTCFGHAATVAGALDAGVEYGLNVWDSIPAWLLTEEAGGKCEIIDSCVNEKGNRLYGFVFGKEGVVDRILSILNN